LGGDVEVVVGDFSNPKPTVEACQWRLVKCEPLMTACYKSVDEVTIQSFDKQVPSLLALLVHKYKSTDVLLRSCVPAVCRRLPLHRSYSVYLLYWYKSTNAEGTSEEYVGGFLYIGVILALLVQKYKY